MTKLGDIKWDKQESTKKPLGDGDKQTIVEYYEAGLKTGKRSEDLLTELAERYGRSPRQISRYVSEARESGKPYQETPHKHKILNYSRESLMEGTGIFVPPALAIEIPLVVEKGEAITLIKAEVVEEGSEHYIDFEVLDDSGKSVVKWDRNIKRAVFHYLLPGHYILRLGNEYQSSFEKRVFVQVRWEPYTGDAPPPPFEFADFRISSLHVIPKPETKIDSNPSENTTDKDYSS